MSFDALTGDLWIADVGEGEREEVNFLPASSTGGDNFGWRVMEGELCSPTFECSQPCPGTGFTAPVVQFDHDLGFAVIGGHVYRGSAIPSLYGKYVYGEWGNAMVWELEYDGLNVLGHDLVTSDYDPPGADHDFNRITSFGLDADG